MPIDADRCQLFAPENAGLGDDPFILGRPIFKGELLVLGRVCLYYATSLSQKNDDAGWPLFCSRSTMAWK